MKKATKGALAAAAAGSLLLGGAGSLAYWTDTGSVDGTSITSGHLTLTPVGDGCTGWKFDGVSGTAYDPLHDLIVPGDVLTQVCSYTVGMAGNHITAKFAVDDAPTFDGASDTGLTDELDPTAAYRVTHLDNSFETVSQAAALAGVAIVEGDVIRATVTVDFTNVTDNLSASQDVSAVLNNITITATQGHSAS